MLRLWEFLTCQRRGPSSQSSRSSSSTRQRTSDGPASSQRLVEGQTRQRLRVSVLALSGDTLGPLDFEVDSRVDELKGAIFDKWGMPPQAQKWVVGTTVVDSQRGSSMSAILLAAAEEHTDAGDSDILTNEETVIEMSCLRVALGAEDQERLDDALLVAAAEGDCEQLRELLRYGADAAASSQAKWPKALRATLFSQAAGAEAATNLLREAGCPMVPMAPDLKLPGRKHPSPHLVDVFRHRCQQGDVVELVRLLHAKADPNFELRDGQGIRDTQRGTPLHAVCGFRAEPGTAALATILCRLGADVNAPDAEGDTPLSHARYFGKEVLFRVIEKNGGTMQGPYYSTPHILGRRFLGWR